MKYITILSGKGGVGKSSITASLAVALSKNKKIICADCDVDASNLSLVLGTAEKDNWVNLSTNKKAKFDLAQCTSCKKCYENCYFNSIDWKENKPKLKEFSCEGCGYCQLLCPSKAITLEKVNNAMVGDVTTKYGFKVVSAQLNIGASGSGKVVYQVRKMAKELSGDSEIMLIDSSAGIGCPVIASITGTDYAIIVTEPTPSGFSDMTKAIEIVNHFKVPYGIIINKFDINEFSNSISKKKILAKIPYDKKFTQALVELKPIIEFEKSYENLFNKIVKKIELIL